MTKETTGEKKNYIFFIFYFFISFLKDRSSRRLSSVALKFFLNIHVFECVAS